MNLGVVLAVVFTAGWIPVFLFRTEILRDVLPVYRRREKFWVLHSPMALGLHVGASCLLLSLSDSVAPWRFFVGVAVYTAGIGFWLWARAAIGPLRARWRPDDPPLRFRRDGPFALVRNPLYFGVLLAAAAPAIAAGHPALAGSFAYCALALWIRAGQEERRLHQQLGPVYTEYCRRVKRLIPYVL